MYHFSDLFIFYSFTQLYHCGYVKLVWEGKGLGCLGFFFFKLKPVYLGEAWDSISLEAGRPGVPSGGRAGLVARACPSKLGGEQDSQGYQEQPQPWASGTSVGMGIAQGQDVM